MNRVRASIVALGIAFGLALAGAIRVEALALELQPGRQIALLPGVVAGTAWLAVGLLLRVRRPQHRLGWILALIGILVPWGVGSQDLLRAAIVAGVSTETYRWLNGMTWAFVILLVTVLVVTFPDGRTRPGSAGRLDRLLVGIALLGVPWTVVVIPLTGASGLFREVWLWVAMVAVIVSMASPIGRWQQSSGMARAQLKWFAWSFLLVVLGGLTAVVTTILTGLADWGPSIVSMAVPPVAIGTAILRYRLFEIDRVISRTVSWAVISGILVLVFGAVVIALQGLLQGFTQGQTLAVAASTLVAFALFQPLRRRVQAAVDHRFDRARFDAQQTSEGFAERVRNEVDLLTLRLALVRTTDQAVRPVASGVWLRREGSSK